ncbi:hypothetical protein PTKU46_36440 [Paraburkholderia terrae]
MNPFKITARDVSQLILVKECPIPSNAAETGSIREPVDRDQRTEREPFYARQDGAHTSNAR